MRQIYGFETYLIVDACRAVNLQKNDEAKALETMQKAGVPLMVSSDILAKS